MNHPYHYLILIAVGVASGQIGKFLSNHFGTTNTHQNDELVKLAEQEYLENKNHRNRQRRKDDENLYAICVALLSSGIVYWLLVPVFPFIAVVVIAGVSAVGSFILAKLDYSIATDKLFPPFK